MVAKGQIAEYVWRSEFEKAERDFAVQRIVPGMRVLNIGANAGLYTIIASKLVGTAGEVHAFEPSSRNFGLLKANIELNQCRNVVANNLALSNFQGRLSLHSDPLHPDYDGHFFVRRLTDVSDTPSQPMEIIPCTTLDDYWQEACGGEMHPVDFIIIDVEGAELSVLEGARRTFAASPNLGMIMECTEQIPEIGAFLEEFGFETYHLGSETSSLLPTEIERGSLVALRGIHAHIG
jgi:FkbM family methyltransferase